jgi:hypothetical protein
MSHLEDLISEYYDWQGYLVKRNVKVGRLAHGGWEMELDVLAYHPHDEHLVHIESSIDAHSWPKREERFKKKFHSGTRHMFQEIFTWLDANTPVEQVAILINHPKGRDELAGGKIKSVDKFVAEVRNVVNNQGVVSKNAIPEKYPLLRTIQLTHLGYYRAV